jgi:hypothetical protein
MFKRLIIAFLLAVPCFLPKKSNAQIPISPYLFGQNAWMPDSIGKRKYFGRLHKNWHQIEASSAQTVRFGGIGPDDNMPSKYQYIQMIDSIRNRGMEPIMQVPYYKGKHTAKQAAEIVKYINVTMKKNIKYWIIGNEPDHVYHFKKSSQVAPYLRSFSFAMRDADPTIKIIGPETAWFNREILGGLTKPGGPDDVTGKDSKGRYILDYISFHSYPFSGSQTRDQVINNLMTPGKYNDELKELNSWLVKANNHHKRTGHSAIKVGVTEANICFKNNPNDNLEGTGAPSFIGGQFWAEFLGISMRHGVEFFNFWSVLEGNNQMMNIGYIDRTTNKRQPSWYHFKMMADNFKGFYAPAKSNMANAKVFASKNNNQVVVMLMNQSATSNRNFSIKFNNSSISGDDPIKINVDAGIDVAYMDHISNQSTLLLIFDAQGNLIRKCEYSYQLHAKKDLPPSCIELTPPSAQITAPAKEICPDAELIMTINKIEGFKYQWNRDGKSINGATGLTYVAKTAGKYTVTLTKERTVFVTEAFDVKASILAKAEIQAEGLLNICSSRSVTLKASQGNGYNYRWIFNGLEIPGESNSTYYASLPGNYQVKIQNDCGERTSEALEVTGCKPTAQSLEGGSKSESIVQVYPNPNNGLFTLEMQAEGTTPENIAVIEVVNMAGQLVHQAHPKQSNGFIKQAIGLDADLPPGIYTIRVKIGAESYSNRFILNRN